MAVSAAELITAINAAGIDSPAIAARVFTRLAAQDALDEARGRLAQGQAIAATRQQTVDDKLTALQDAVTDAQEALDALAGAPDVSGDGA